MPRRSDIHTILVPGSGPIVIGQAAEFDYSGTQAVKALRVQGYRVVLVNSNPATIMTDPELADATYIEAMTPGTLEAIIAQERPDALLPTVGGQTGLNLLALSEMAFRAFNIRLLGASARHPGRRRSSAFSPDVQQAPTGAQGVACSLAKPRRLPPSRLPAPGAPSFAPAAAAQPGYGRRTAKPCKPKASRPSARPGSSNPFSAGRNTSWK
jgi:hypothetical protein